jgi:hypothetical protein
MRFTKQLMLISLIVMRALYSQAQNVGIGTINPPYKLTVQTPKTSNNWGFVQTDSNIVLGSFIYSLTRGGIAEFGTQTNSPFYLFANNLDLPPAIAIEKNGVNVGIGNETPVYSLDVHSLGNAQFNLQEGIGGHTALFSRYTNRLEIQPSDAFEVSVGGIDQRNLCIANNGYVGIGNSIPNNKFEIGTATGFSGNDLAIGNNGKGMSFYQAPAASTWYSNTNFAIMPNSGGGFVGIGTTTPLTKLEVLANGYGIIQTDGTVRVGTYVGSGGGWMGTQTNNPLYLFANNSNALMTVLPNGNIGIGTINPSQKLEVNGNVQVGGSIIVENVQSIALLNGFMPAGAGFSAPQFYKDKENQVHLRGAAYNDLHNNVWETLGYLPAGYRPLNPEHFTANDFQYSGISTIEVVVNTDGAISVHLGRSGTCTISGITFRVDQ